jgi:hypothetical protein
MTSANSLFTGGNCETFTDERMRLMIELKTRVDTRLFICDWECYRMWWKVKQQSWAGHIADTIAKPDHEHEAGFKAHPWCNHCAVCGDLLYKPESCVLHDACPAVSLTASLPIQRRLITLGVKTEAGWGRAHKLFDEGERNVTVLAIQAFIAEDEEARGQ